MAYNRHKECVLYDRLCIECGECDLCDIDPQKVCDNCMQCIQSSSDYRAIRIDGVLTDEEKIATDDDTSQNMTGGGAGES